MYQYTVTFINGNGETIVRDVVARNEFEAVQLAGAFNCVVISAVNNSL